MAHAIPLLETENLSVTFGGLKAAHNISLRVDSGQLVGLIGPNGAGKTTFLDAVMGFVKATGQILLAGQDVSTWPPHRRARAGLLRSWQSLELFDELTVMENLMVVHDAVVARRSSADRTRKQDLRSPVALPEILRMLRIAEMADRLPSELAQGERKLVSVARALAGRPHVLCMDEPAAGLDTSESLALGEHLRALVDDGLAILLVDHDMSLVLSVCDWVYVLEFGAVIAHGTPGDIRSNETVIAAYLGQRTRATKSSSDDREAWGRGR